MAYIRNFRGSSGNRAIISGSNVQVTGSLFGSVISGTTAQLTSLTGSTAYFSSKVGIGTTNPAAPLTVAGASTGVIEIGPWTGVSPYGAIYLNGDFSSGNNYNFLSSPEDKNLFINRPNNNIFFRMNNMDQMILNSAGNLGIGTTAPSAKLDVAGTAEINGLHVNESTTSDQFTYFAPQKYIEDGTRADDTCFYSVQGDFNVSAALDTTVPFSKVVYNDISTALYSDFIPVQAGETLFGEVWAMQKTGVIGSNGFFYYGIARYDKDKKPIAGNLGLQYFVASGITVPSNDTWTKYSGQTTLPTSHTPFDGSDGGPVRYVRVLLLVNYGAVGAAKRTHWAGLILRRKTLIRDSGDVVLTVSGNVGIGTSNPNYTLDVSSPVGSNLVYSRFKGTTGGIQFLSNNGIGEIDLINSSGTPIISLFNAGNNVLAGETNVDFEFRTNNTEKMRITAGGNVGIGTSSPSARLQVVGSSSGATGPTGGSISDSSAYLTNTNDIYGMMFGVSGSGTGWIQQQRRDSNVQYPLLLNPLGGNVGIGTTNPVAKLDVDSGGFKWASWKASTTAASFMAFVKGGTTTDIGYIGTDGGGILSGGFGNNFGIRSEYDLLMMAGSAERARINSAGNVGIGTNNPQNPLHVSGNGAIFNLEGSDHAYIQYYPKGFSSGRRSYVGFSSPTSNVFSIANESATGGDIVISPGAGGNVGIGTTSPNAKLNVNGGIINIDGNNTPTGAGLAFGDNNSGGYKWIQSFNSQPIAINPLGNNVGIGTTSPNFTLAVTGTLGVSGGITGNLTGNASSATQVNNSITFNNGGAGNASGTAFNGSAARTISYNTVGAPSTSGTGATGTWGISITGNAATVTNGITTTNITSNAVTSLTAGNGLTGTAAVGSVTLNVGAGTGISVAADTVGIDNTVVATLADNQTFTSTKTFNPPSATSTSSYVAEFRNSSTTNNASRFIWSQGSTYALAVNVQGTAGTSATTDLQWINRSTGVVQSTPMTLNYNGDVTIPNGNLVVGTAGKGISFANTTPDGTGASDINETLDDYEEGTFTPTVYGGISAGTRTGGAVNGTYVKIGKLVYIKAEVYWTSHTGTGQLRIGGLPFNPEDNVPLTIWHYDLTYTAGGTVFAYTQLSGFVALYYTTSGNTITQLPMDTNGATIVINGCYSVA